MDIVTVPYSSLTLPWIPSPSDDNAAEGVGLVFGTWGVAVFVVVEIAQGE